MKRSDFDKAMLVEFAVREVGAGSLEEMQAVVYCIRNRVRKGWHDGKWVENIEHAYEYSAHDYAVVGLARLTQGAKLDCDQRNFQRLLNSIDDLYYAQPRNGVGWDGKRADEDAQGFDLEAAIGSSTYWMFLRRPIRPWFAENVIHAPEMMERANMGMMKFFASRKP